MGDEKFSAAMRSSASRFPGTGASILGCYYGEIGIWGGGEKVMYRLSQRWLSLRDLEPYGEAPSFSLSLC